MTKENTGNQTGNVKDDEGNTDKLRAASPMTDASIISRCPHSLFSESIVRSIVSFFVFFFICYYTNSIYLQGNLHDDEGKQPNREHEGR